MKTITTYALLTVLLSCRDIPSGLAVCLENTNALHIENVSDKRIEDFDSIRVNGYFRTIFFESYYNPDLKALDFITDEDNKRIEEVIIRSDLRGGVNLDLCRYENLKILDLSSCSLPTKFESKCTHPNVVHLDLSRNTLDAIPRILYQFPNIEDINLKNNNIDKFTLDLKLFFKLKSIDIRNNPIEAKADSLRKAYPNITFVTVL